MKPLSSSRSAVLAALIGASAILLDGCGPRTQETADTNSSGASTADSNNYAAESSQPASTGGGPGAAGSGSATDASSSSQAMSSSDAGQTAETGGRATPSGSFATANQDAQLHDQSGAPTEQRIRTELRDGAIAMDDAQLQDIDIQVSNETVTLTGIAPSEDAIRQIEQRVRQVEGVRQVNNQLQARSAAE